LSFMLADLILAPDPVGTTFDSMCCLLLTVKLSVIFTALLDGLG